MADTTSVASAAPKDNRKVWQKNSYDVDNQTKDNATEVGFVRHNDSRVDIVSTMDKNMKQQVFSFQNVATGKVQVLSQQANKTVRLQVLNQAGQVIADSKNGQGQATKTYLAMVNGTYDLKQGKYYVVVQRDPKQALDTQINYNVQVKDGSTVKNDYITNAIPEPASIKRQNTLTSLLQVKPTIFGRDSNSIFGSNSSDPFGLGNYDIFGQRKYG